MVIGVIWYRFVGRSFCMLGFNVGLFFINLLLIFINFFFFLLNKVIFYKLILVYFEICRIGICVVKSLL